MALQDYATVDELKRYLRIPGVYEGTLNTDIDTYDDLEIALAITGASREIDRFCNRYFGLTDAQTRYYTAQTSRSANSYSYAYGYTYVHGYAYEVRIDDVPTTSGLSVALDSSCDYSYATTASGDSYRLDPPNALVQGDPVNVVRFTRSQYVPNHQDGIAVTAIYGYPEIPPTIKQACLIQAARTYKRRDAPFGVAGSPELGSELRLLNQLDPDVQQLCASYRKWWAAA